MLFRCLFFCLVCFFLEAGNAALQKDFFSLEESSEKSIPLSPIWATDFDQAFAQAQQEKKILILACLGNSWCPWAEKLKRDVLNSPLFIDKLQGIARFAVQNLDHEDTEHNRRLRQMLRIDQSPTLILLDYSQEEIARIGFLPLEGEKYADQILELVRHFEEVIAFLKAPKSVASEERIAQLYIQAKRLSSQSYREQILDIGLKREKGSFFILEKYANLLNKQKFKSLPVQKTRRELMQKDPENSEGTRLKMAVLEFQKFSSKVKGKKQVFRAISPLVEYIEKFGKDDSDNLWKVEMMIAQFLLTQNELEMALSHAKASLDAAPEIAKNEVKDVVDYLNGL